MLELQQNSPEVQTKLKLLFDIYLKSVFNSCSLYSDQFSFHRCIPKYSQDFQAIIKQYNDRNSGDNEEMRN